MENLRFRNYLPQDEGLKELYEKVDRPSLFDAVGDGQGSAEAGAGVADGSLQALERELRAERELKTDAVSAEILSKRANWDLKKDCEKRMKKLERRTQRAIVQILRDRIAREARESGRDID